MRSWLDPAHVDMALDSRAVTFENPTGERGAGGRSHGGRKGAPSRRIAAGERVVLADLTGPGRVRHIWMTFPPAPPEIMRGLTLEAFYDGATEPSVSVPCLDFFGLPHGRPTAYGCALLAAQEGRGFNAYLPLPFRDRLRMEVVNHAARDLTLYYQLDYTLEPEMPADVGHLHVIFRRENPTVQERDFIIHEGLQGPGGELHPVQKAFMTELGPQCGFCTPGQIMSAVGLLKVNPNPTRDEARLAMSGNLCRCGAYDHYLNSIMRAAREA